ncbi:MAG: TonB-dependent receptor [Cyclobacteriaceae bacterium]|nr:TonB-dependent receptor [Cyclobacteriaceae bacterium]
MRTALQLILLFITSTAFAQTRISGAVTDERGAAIPGANVSIEGTYDGASTSLEGVFQFETSETGAQNILITFVGFKAFRQLVNLVGEPIQLQVALREEINQLDAVVISAGSFTAGEEKRRTVLKAIDIATTAGATADIAGALNTLPGTQKVGESGRLFVRGGDGSETKTFIDGMLVANAYSPSAPNTPSRGRFLPFMFKGTSFSTGGYSAEYGQALSSALVLDSKDKAELNQTDLGLLSVGGDVAHTQVWDRASVSGKIQYTNIRPYFGLINQEIDWITPPASIEGSTAFRQEVGEHGIVKFFGNFNHSDFKLNNHDILNPNQKTPFAYANNYGYGNASFLQALNDSWSVKGGLSYNYNENNIVLNDSPIDEVEKAIHAKLVFENTVSDHVELKFGVEQLQSNYEASRIDSLSLKQTVAFSTPISAGFVEAELYASKYFVTRAGVRTEYNGLIDKLNVDPRVSIAYKPFTYGQFSLAYGQFRQATQNQFLRINQNLEEEKAEHFILNYQVINNQRTFRAELYHKRYANLVKFINGNPEQLTNAGDGYAQGFELFWRDSKTVRNLDYWISYSYLDTERDYLHFPTPSTPSFASAHNFSVVGKKFISEIKSQVGVTYSYSSPRAYNNPNSESFNTGRTPVYQDLSVNVSYLPKPFLIIHLSVTNVLGRDNIFGYDYSEAPDSNGNYLSRAIRQPAKRFLFLGVFFTISKNKSVNQLPNL